MITNGFSGLTKKERQLIVDNFITVAFIFLDNYDNRDWYDMANDDYAEFVADKLTEWENSEEFMLDMPRCESIELFCRNNRVKWRKELCRKGEK